MLILMAHTGGGHLRAAEAVAEALRRRYGAAATVEMVDALGDYAPWPFNHLAAFYPWWIDHAPRTWDWGYRLTDDPKRAALLLRCLWSPVWPRARRLLRAHPCDVIVSMHPLTNHYLAWALRRLGRATPLLTLVTDPVSVHPFWLAPGVDRCLVAGEEARRKAIACGLDAAQVRVTGLPVDPCFADGLLDKSQARRALGWSAERLAVLLVGGVEGMGRVYEMARAIDAACPGVELAVVAGRNRRLHQRLLGVDWRRPAHVYGFVHHTREMPHLMSAADLLITKAGPGTLHEAFLAGLPLLLSDAVPGQEEGNVRLVVEGGAGVWAPAPEDAAALVRRWMDREDGALARMAACSRALARPDAAHAVAQEVWRLVLTNL